MKKTLGILIVILAACGSNSTHDLRFTESETLSAPITSISVPNPNQFSFAIVGDTHVGGGNTTRLKTILNQAKSESDSFVVLLGDIVEDGERSDILAVKAAIDEVGWTNKVISVIGNHDVFNDGWKHYKELEGRTHFTVDVGNSRFMILDTADGVVGDRQENWLKGELNKSLPANVFFLSHYLPMVPGQRTYLRLSNETEAVRLMKLASNRKVKGWYGGHYHGFGIEEIESVKYVVAGGGGGRRMKPLDGFFFVQVTVDGENISYQLREIN